MKLLCLFVLALVALSIAYAKQKSGGAAAPTTGTVINLGPCNGNDATCFKQKYAVVYAVHHTGDRNSAIPCKVEAACTIEIKMELFYTLDDVQRRPDSSGRGRHPS